MGARMPGLDERERIVAAQARTKDAAEVADVFGVSGREVRSSRGGSGKREI